MFVEASDETFDLKMNSQSPRLHLHLSTFRVYFSLITIIVNSTPQHSIHAVHWRNSRVWRLWKIYVQGDRLFYRRKGASAARRSIWSSFNVYTPSSIWENICQTVAKSRKSYLHFKVNNIMTSKFNGKCCKAWNHTFDKLKSGDISLPFFLYNIRSYSNFHSWM